MKGIFGQLPVAVLVGVAGCIWSICGMVAVAEGADEAAATVVPTAEAVVPTVAPVAVDSVAVSVDGHDIMESEVEALLIDVVTQQMRGKAPGTDQLDYFRKRHRETLIDDLINLRLLEQAAEAEKVPLNDEDIEKVIEAMIQVAMENRSVTREELDEQIRKERGISLDESIMQLRTNPKFKANVLRDQLLQKKYADRLAVSGEEVQQYYQEKYSQRRASHILLMTMDSKTRRPKSEEEVAEARKKIQEILVEVKKPGADFAELAKKYSECPSGAKGGDLGFFPRQGQGAMVEPFAAATWALEPNQTSEVVETQFGYHIIKTTGIKAPEELMAFAKIEETLNRELRNQKKQEVMQEYLEELKKSAKLVYPAAEKSPGDDKKTTTPMQKPPQDESPPVGQ